MVFSSLEFIYIFMPVTLIGFLLIRALRLEMPIILWLIGASLVFYAYWSVPFLALLLGSITANYGLHLWLKAAPDRRVLVLGVALNLAAIAYFKYAGFLISNVNALTGTGFDAGDIVLPLAISFFTFQQIAFLVETYRGECARSDFPRYVLFVVFFPQLIAGPIVMQKDTVPQFTLETFTSRLGLNISLGLTLFLIGLFKKIVIADTMAGYATPVFEMADAGQAVPLETAWLAALGYTFQIYFDFSGYSDMALGLARLFGIRLPINFNSPYKATSIVDFWRRWHITLSHFLRDYLYIPLGGNRGGKVRRYANLAITMFLGGLWHGASWNFVLWGGLHGCFLVINHAWTALTRRIVPDHRLPKWITRWSGRLCTMLAVIVAWVFFRAETFDGALAILTGMAGQSGTIREVQSGTEATLALDRWSEAGSIFVLLFAFVWFLPNAVELTARYRPSLYFQRTLSALTGWRARMAWRPNLAWVAVLATITVVSMTQLYRAGDLSEFIYYNF